MRVLIVNKFARVKGGADRHCLELADALRTAGHEVAFLSTASVGNQTCRGAFVPCSVTGENRRALGLVDAQRAGRRGLWNATAAAAALRLLDDFCPDVVHLHKLYPQLSVAPAVIAARRGVPVVQTLHDYELLAGRPLDDGHLQAPAPPIAERLLAVGLHNVQRRFHLPAVNAWVAGSSYLARAHARIGLAAAVLPLPTAAPVGIQPPFTARRGVVFAGRLAPEKGVLDIVELARGAPRLDVTLLGNGPLAGQLRERSRNLSNLHLIGATTPDGVWRSLLRARVLAVPSLWSEPVGLAALEAMAVGTPVVAYAVGGLAEQVASAGGGVLIPADQTALIEACTALHDNEERWAALSAAGRAHVRREHEPARYVTRLLGVYAEAGAPA